MADVSLKACCVSSFEPSVVSLLDDVGDVVGQALRPKKKGLRANEENSGRRTCIARVVHFQPIEDIHGRHGGINNQQRFHVYR